LVGEGEGAGDIGVGEMRGVFVELGIFHCVEFVVVEVVKFVELGVFEGVELFVGELVFGGVVAEGAEGGEGLGQAGRGGKFGRRGVGKRSRDREIKRRRDGGRRFRRGARGRGSFGLPGTGDPLRPRRLGHLPREARGRVHIGVCLRHGCTKHWRASRQWHTGAGEGGCAEDGVGAAAALGGVGGGLERLAEGLGDLAAELLGPEIVAEGAEGLDQFELGLDVGLGEPVGEVEEVEAESRGGGGEVGGGVEEGGEEAAVGGG
jgi:hypothetical protein